MEVHSTRYGVAGGSAGQGELSVGLNSLYAAAILGVCTILDTDPVTNG
jgi:hypothetical protein